jgi:hypothetical protein
VVEQASFVVELEPASPVEELLVMAPPDSELEWDFVPYFYFLLLFI